MKGGSRRTLGGLSGKRTPSKDLWQVLNLSFDKPCCRVFPCTFWMPMTRTVPPPLPHLVTEKVQDIEVTIPVKKSQKTYYNFDPAAFFVNRFWGKRDGFSINEALQIVYILEFKRSTDRDEGFLEVKEAEANEQHKIIIGALRAAAPKWELSRLTLWWVTADQLLKATSTPSSKSLMYKNESLMYKNKGKKNLRWSCHTGFWSAHSGAFVLPPAGARRYEANHIGIEGKHQAQCARVKRCREEHTLIEGQSWGPSNDSGRW